MPESLVWSKSLVGVGFWRRQHHHQALSVRLTEVARWSGNQIGLRPHPAPLGDQGGVRRGGDLLTARRDGCQPEGRGTGREEDVPCTPPLGPEGLHPRREEITASTPCGQARTTCADYVRTRTVGTRLRRRAEGICQPTVKPSARSRPAGRGQRWRSSSVSVVVSFATVRLGPAAANGGAVSQVGTGTAPHGLPPADLESVRGASLRGFKSHRYRQPEQAKRRASR